MRKPKRETHAVAAVPRGSRYGAAPLLGGVLILFTYLYAINAWMSDDAYISFRTIDNLFQGYGLRWNVVERVQAYTNPLWLFVIMLPSFFTREFYFTSLAVSDLLCRNTRNRLDFEPRRVAVPGVGPHAVEFEGIRGFHELWIGVSPVLSF